MNQKDIKSRLENGSKLVKQYNAYINDDYYLDKWGASNKLTRAQFEKFKPLCKNKDESSQGSCIIGSMPYMHYYWM